MPRYGDRRPSPATAGTEPIARILLVDEVRRLVELMKHYLKRTTCRVLTARTGAEALRLCQKEPLDLVFLDASMTRMDGIEVCRALKADPRLISIPIVLVAPRERTLECREAGCDDVLAKPVLQEEFLACVRRFVSLRERGEERIPASLRVEFRAPAGSYTAYTKDLSPHGAFLKSPRPFAPGTRLMMTLHLPGGRPPLVIAGEVRRVVEAAPGGHLLPGVGVRFLDVSPGSLKALEEFIAERVPKRSGE